MNFGASRDGASGRSPRAAHARAPTRSSPVTRSTWIVLQRCYICIVHPNEAKNKYTHDRPTPFVRSSTRTLRLRHPYARAFRSHPSWKYIEVPRASMHSFIHSFAEHARRGRETRDADARRRSIEPIVRSFASIRSHRFVHLAASHISRTRSRRPIADSPRPGRRVERANRRSRVRRSSDLSLSLAVDVDVIARAASTGRVDFHSRGRSRARRGRDDDDDATTRARRDRSTRATSRRRRRGLGSTDAGVGDLTSRDSWTCGAGHTTRRGDWRDVI